MLKFPNFLVGSEKTVISDLFRVRFWKNIQHESCRSRSELYAHIKFIKIGRRMKKLGPDY